MRYPMLASLTAGLLMFGQQASAAMMADFEPPTYEGNPATQTDIDGTNGWLATGGQGTLFPDNTSGYVPPGYPPLAGTQSYVLWGPTGIYQAKGFGGDASQVGNESILAALTGVEVYASGSGTLAGFYLSDNVASGSTPGGIEYWKPTHTFALYGQGGTDVISAIPWVNNVVYKVEIEMDFTTDTFNGYVTDITNSGPRQLIGTQQFDNALDAGTTAANGGVVITGGFNGSSSYWDNIEINAVPEPASLGLLGIFGLLALSRRRA